MAVYREQHEADQRWRVSHERLSEEELPEPVQRAFEAFEKQLRQQQNTRAKHFDLELGSERETFFPHYESMKLESLGWSIAAALFMWMLGVGVVGLVNVALLFVVVVATSPIHPHAAHRYS